MADPVPLLQVSGLTRRFGAVAAVDSVDLVVRPGEALGVIGPNGAGKSTFIGLISGALAPSSGRILLFGREAADLSPQARARLGVGRTHQIPRPFAAMSVRENLEVAARHARDPEPPRRRRERCDDILDRTGLIDLADQPAGGLPLLRRKRLELARALALKPRLLLLDEIGAGLVERETRELIELIRSIRTEIEGLVLIEHVMEVIVALCERTAVLDAGRLLTVGPTREVLADPRVVAAYLGASAGAAAPSARPSPPAAQAAAPLLSVESARVSYGGVRALRGVDLEIRPGEVVALLGANGAGKTTLASAISGAAPLQAGRIRFRDLDLAGLRPDQVAAVGLAHCPEGRRIFGTLTVEENLILATETATPAERARRLQCIYGLFPTLAEQRAKPGKALSGGQQQMLAIGRALMSEPALVIFDEISLGLAPAAIDHLYEALAAVRASGVAMLLVEAQIDRALRLADRVYVLSHGEVALQGRPEEIRASPALQALYVGDPVD